MAFVDVVASSSAYRLAKRCTDRGHSTTASAAPAAFTAAAGTGSASASPSSSNSVSNAWARHHAEVTERYVRFLKRAKKAGELKAYSERELPTLAQLLVAARDYIYRSHLTTHAPGRDIPTSIVKTYRRFIEFGLGQG